MLFHKRKCWLYRKQKNFKQRSRYTICSKETRLQYPVLGPFEQTWDLNNYCLECTEQSQYSTNTVFTCSDSTQTESFWTRVISESFLSTQKLFFWLFSEVLRYYPIQDKSCCPRSCVENHVDPVKPLKASQIFHAFYLGKQTCKWPQPSHFLSEKKTIANVHYI